jgi:transposase
MTFIPSPFLPCPIAAGIDVGRDFLDVAIAPSGRWFKAPNAAGGVQLIIDRLRRAGVGRVVLESIGPYASRLIRALAEAGFAVGVVDPKRIKALRFAEGGRAKTDRLDAKLIARFALIMSDATRPIPSAENLEIRALSTRHRRTDRAKPSRTHSASVGRARARRASTRSARADKRRR